MLKYYTQKMKLKAHLDDFVQGLEASTRCDLTNSMEQSPSWEANNCSASQEIPILFWNPTVDFRAYNNPPPVSIWAR
jgi:hypothetical protein